MILATVPTSDIIEHIDFSENCPCRPIIEYHGKDTHIIHHRISDFEKDNDNLKPTEFD